VLIEVPEPRPPQAAPAHTPSRAPAAKPRAPDAPVAAPLVPPSAPGEALASDVPRAAPTGEAPSRGAAGGLVLLPKNPRFDLPAQLPEEKGSTHGIPEAPRQRSVQELVGELAEDVQGRSRAELGTVHPYFVELGKALLAAWHPDGVVERSAETLQAQRKATLHDAVNTYLERAKAYGRTGSAFSGLQGVQDPRAALPANGPLDASQYTTGYVAMSAGMQEYLEKKASAQVRLVQDREGRLLTLELVKASAHPEVDRLALQDLRAAGQRLPVPPPEALGLRNRLVSTWELSVHPRGDGDRHSGQTFVASLAGLGWSKQVRLLSGL
jgi:hypothetical protein